ncbi:MAG: DUF2007 domain-containing protein [Flavobacteriaceae bacterium]|nr:MAG: DUF2007 domain-containing protein [Flavobacteriaceae bacterium]
MHESEYVKIFTGSIVITKLITSRLEEIGITPVVKESQILGASLDGSQEIYVREDELSQSVPIVEEVRSTMSA